jgi:hypothetical protein
VLPDQGLYEERYRLTGAVAASLAVSLVMLGFSFHGTHDTFWLALSVLAFVSITVPALTAVATKRIAFRADPMGVTLGGDPISWTGRSGGTVFIPWFDVEKIVIYREGTGKTCVGVQRRASAPPLPRGNNPARRCPVTGVAEGATRQTVAWRLDRERLTALVAAVAPAIPVIDTERTPIDTERTPAEAAGADGAAAIEDAEGGG